jgi:hypothetical protein
MQWRSEMLGKLNSVLADGFVESLWETVISLATAAGICVSIISLASHLNETRAVRSAVGPSVATTVSTAGVADLNGAAVTSNLN